MRLINRHLFRKWVRRVDIGEDAVHEVWHGNRKLYPGEDVVARRVIMGGMPEEGSLDWAYWVHMVQATTRQSYLTDAGYAELRIGEYAWAVNDIRRGGLPWCRVDELGNIFFESDVGLAGIPMDSVGPGDVVKIEANIGGHETVGRVSCGARGSNKMTLPVPWLPGSRLKWTDYKGQKKLCCQGWLNVKGYGAGQVHLRHHIGVWENRGGHTRGNVNFSVNCRSWNSADYDIYTKNDGLVAGEVGLSVDVRSNNDGSVFEQARVAFPSFKKVFTFRVSQVIK